MNHSWEPSGLRAEASKPGLGGGNPPSSVNEVLREHSPLAVYVVCIGSHTARAGWSACT